MNDQKKHTISQRHPYTVWVNTRKNGANAGVGISTENIEEDNKGKFVLAGNVETHYKSRKVILGSQDQANLTCQLD
jgi:hypothetical protein